MITLYDAPRCPFCARARIVLAEKQVEYETVIVDLDERPDWIIALNPPDGRVPVMEQPGLPLLPESRVIMRYVEERFDGPALLPQSLEERALVDPRAAVVAVDAGGREVDEGVQIPVAQGLEERGRRVFVGAIPVHLRGHGVNHAEDPPA